jgi:hypothetical protein
MAWMSRGHARSGCSFSSYPASRGCRPWCPGRLINPTLGTSRSTISIANASRIVPTAYRMPIDRAGQEISALPGPRLVHHRPMSSMKSYLVSVASLLACVPLAAGQDANPQAHLIRHTGPAPTSWARPDAPKTAPASGPVPTCFAEEQTARPTSPLPFTQLEAVPPAQEAQPNSPRSAASDVIPRVKPDRIPSRIPF